MRDAVALEARGIPVAAIVTESFVHVFSQTAKLLGAEDLRPVVIPHPLAALEEEEIQDRAEQAAKQIAAMLTEDR